MHRQTHLRSTLDELQRHLGAPHCVLTENNEAKRSPVQVFELQGVQGRGAEGCQPSKPGKLGTGQRG